MEASVEDGQEEGGYFAAKSSKICKKQEIKFYKIEKSLKNIH